MGGGRRGEGGGDRPRGTGLSYEMLPLCLLMALAAAEDIEPGAGTSPSNGAWVGHLDDHRTDALPACGPTRPHLVFSHSSI